MISSTSAAGSTIIYPIDAHCRKICATVDIYYMAVIQGEELHLMISYDNNSNVLTILLVFK